jgi:hypothetical protein
MEALTARDDDRARLPAGVLCRAYRRHAFCRAYPPGTLRSSAQQFHPARMMTRRHFRPHDECARTDRRKMRRSRPEKVMKAAHLFPAAIRTISPGSTICADPSWILVADQGLSLVRRWGRTRCDRAAVNGWDAAGWRGSDAAACRRCDAADGGVLRCGVLAGVGCGGLAQVRSGGLARRSASFRRVGGAESGGLARSGRGSGRGRLRGRVTRPINGARPGGQGWEPAAASQASSAAFLSAMPSLPS